jgi:hypothetical protein
MARKKRRVVPIPKPPQDAFNKNRRAGTLLQAQTLHLRHALARHLQKVTRHLEKIAALLAIDVSTIKTEGDVSDYAKRVTAILHMQGGKRVGK